MSAFGGPIETHEKNAWMLRSCFASLDMFRFILTTAGVIRFQDRLQ